ncbi:MAG: SDR family NAD(P)-dependent oxidoreductase, partial [Pseudomonadota bacterium]
MADSMTVAVTGVTSGIGYETAKMLDSQGHRVVGFDIAEPADTVGQFIRLDLDDADSIATAADAVTEPLDGLFNNAGLPPRDGLEAKLLRVN